MSNFGFIAAADTTNMQAGGTSFLENVGDAFTKGVGAAALSGVQSIYNTGVDLSNKVFGTAAERADTGKTLTELDAGWGDYYKQNKAVIDTAGFFATSLIPGTLAIKGLKAAQSGTMLGRFGSVLGYSSKQEMMYLESALNELAVEGGSVFTRISQAKTLSMAWGTADVVLQTAAYEAATALTMKASPMLDSSDWKNIGWDIIKTSLTGGALGGGINALLTNKVVKDAGLLVAGKQRMYDVLQQTGQIDVAFGDRAYGIIDSVLKLPKEVIDPVVKLSHGRPGVIDSLDTTPLLTATLKGTVQRGIQQLDMQLVHVVANDKTVGQPLAKALVNFVKQGIESGADDTAIRKEAGALLFNLHSVEGIGGRPLDLSGELLYLSPKHDISRPLGTGNNLMTADKQPGDWAYRVVGDTSQARMGTLGKDASTAKEAWAAGFDAVIDPSTRRVQINPFSTVYQQVAASEADFAPMFFNTRTLQTSDTAIATIADVQTAQLPLQVNFGGVQAGSKTFKFSPGIYNEPADTVEATARHLWASDLKRIDGQIDSRDISLLDSLLASPSKAGPDLTIFDAATQSTVRYSDIADFNSYVFKRKYAGMADAHTATAGAGLDLRDLAYRFNVEPAWAEKAATPGVSSKDLFATEGWAKDAAGYAERENLLFRYDTKAMQEASQQTNGIVAYNTRVKEAVSRAEDASAAVLGQDHYKLLINLDKSLASEADGQTVGASLFGSSNAGYSDKLRAWAQYTGQQVGQIVNERVSAALSRIQSPAARLLQNPDAAAEVAAAVTKIRLSTEAQALWQDPLTRKYIMVDYESYNKVMTRGGQVAFKTQIPLSEDAGAFLAAHHEGHMLRKQQESVLKSAQGLETNYNADALYVPPVDTQRVPFFAFVRQQDGTVFGSSEVAMLHARSAAELQQLASQVEKTGNFQVIYKADTEVYHKAKGDYDFDRVLNSPQINSELEKRGILGSFIPSMTPENVVNDFVQYTQRAETKIARDAVSVKYAQTIAELQDLSNRYTAGQSSKFEGLSRLLQRNVTDPFGDAIKLAMNVSKRGEFTLWHQANEFVDAIGTGAGRGIEKALLDARGGQITWQQANDQLEKFGMGAHFTDKEMFQIAQTAPDRNLIKTALQKANMLLANGMLRLDFANSILNVISTPILLGTEVSAIRNSLKSDPEMFAKFGAMLTQQVPGTPLQVPSTLKLLHNAMRSYFGEEGKVLLQRYKDIGAVKGPAALFHEMVDDLSLLPGLVPSAYATKVDSWVEKGAQITGNNRAEEMTRFVSANVMHQLTQPLVVAGKMAENEQNAFINIFVNRVQGNYVAAQRPILFQGTLGSAVGLFQTYQFNLFQQLFRHIENRDIKTIAVMGGLQSTLFGLNGLPMFDAINTQVVGGASINAGHKDAYSYAVQAAGKPLGDWLMYGTPSAFPLFSDKMPALWTRGDLNPRSTFVVPTSPAEVPAVAASLKVLGALTGMAKQLGTGAGAQDALLFGLEHNGINRPLTGLAQIMKGSATTSHGDLIAAAADWNSISTAARLIGAKPMDESIAQSTLFRSRAYQAMDKQRVDLLGTVIKDKLRGNETLSADDWVNFQGEYAAAGGKIDGFGRAVQRWSKGSNVSVINEVMRHNQTPAGQRMIEVLGGDPLKDFTQMQQLPAPE